MRHGKHPDQKRGADKRRQHAERNLDRRNRPSQRIDAEQITGAEKTPPPSELGEIGADEQPRKMRNQ